MNVLVLHGPNLNLLGLRPGGPSHPTLVEINAEIQQRAGEFGISLHILQSNHEGVLIDALHDQRQWFDGVVLSPSALGATSYALRDAISAVVKPVFEVYPEEIRKMEPWKRKSLLKPVCEGQVAGKGLGAYLIALERLEAVVSKKHLKEKKSMGRATRKGEATALNLPPEVPKPLATKTLGQRPVAISSQAARDSQKTLGKAPAAVPGLTVNPRVSQLGFLTRALVRQKIAERLSGKLSQAGLATWARSQWQEVQRGAPAESGQRDLLEELLQTLFLETVPSHQLSDDQLIELMTRLDG